MKKDSAPSKLIIQELGNPYKRLFLVFLLIGVIPTLSVGYLLCGKPWGGGHSPGDTVSVLFFSNLIMILGYLIGYGMVRNILRKILAYAERAKRADELKSSFAMSLAHDLKSPLAVIKAHVSNLKAGFMGGLSTEQSEALDTCRDVVNRMDSMLNDLVRAYKIEARLTELKISAFDLREILAGQCREFAALAAAKSVSLKLEQAPDALFFRGDRDMLLRAVNNLVNNAIKYTPKCGRITVRARETEGLAKIEVSNTAPRIPEDKLERIFDKFERLEGKVEGEGLGLAIARDIVELHKGRIWASSGPGDFNLFTLLLPLTDRELRS